MGDTGAAFAKSATCAQKPEAQDGFTLLRLADRWYASMMEKAWAFVASAYSGAKGA